MTEQREATTLDRAEFIDRYNDGHSVREIADATGWSISTVSRHLRKAGITHRRRADTAEAVEAKRLEGQARRLDQVQQSQDDADLLRSRLWEPYDVVVQGPNGAETIRLKEPPIKEQADAIRAITSARLADHRILEDMDTEGTSAATAKNVLTNIFDGLSALFADQPDAGLDDQDQDHDYDIRLDPLEQLDQPEQ